MGKRNALSFELAPRYCLRQARVSGINLKKLIPSVRLRRTLDRKLSKENLRGDVWYATDDYCFRLLQASSVVLLKYAATQKIRVRASTARTFVYAAMTLPRPGRLKPSFQERLCALLFCVANPAFNCIQAEQRQPGAGIRSSLKVSYRRPGGPAAAGPGSRSEPEKWDDRQMELAPI